MSKGVVSNLTPAGGELSHWDNYYIHVGELSYCVTKTTMANGNYTSNQWQWLVGNYEYDRHTLYLVNV